MVAMESELLPKKHINADVFTESNPAADGSNTIIAVWDTGVDPTAGGLQVTPDGKPKIIDFIDASGCGDVKMRTKFRLSEDDRTVETLTGRQVKIPPHWKPKTGEVRMGVKLASELFPRALLQRLRSESKDDLWSSSVKRLTSRIAGDYAEAEEHLMESRSAHSSQPNHQTQPDLVNKQNQNIVTSDTRSAAQSPKNFTLADKSDSPGRGLSAARQVYGKRKSLPKGKLHEGETSVFPLTASKNQLKSAARLLEDSLATFDRNYVASEMVYDCFVFHDGSKWVSCVDTSPYNPGKTLADMPLLADFSVGRQCACFGDDTQLFFTVKILNDGKLLQIVTNDSGHGTHVAAMAAAYFPSSEPDQMSTYSVQSTLVRRNGVAPGAQIVSIKISDSRLGSMETGVSLLRAIRWTVKLKCDVVNYSFGEHCVWPNVGQPYSSPCDLFTDGDSTELGMNADTESSELPGSGLRAFGRAAPTAYTWGSRGPALDGSLGLCVAAPGAANTSVASWQLRPCALLNGSSMSAPLVTGCVGS
ncbi:Tripeptidyl-peptidase 2 [Fasciolopsis buskii]|uniref:Tripeptidyl-peptidase 2 n=1 Tax=Fasciolopsis buskii TaxID=27845 RepID=A0A8E0RRQ1_9TREM|nr:Tripeptidyl-peptidase 2 [Fasciolopsis buski]